MSYSINGKIFTSHALMDEIIDNTKTLIKGLVLKNEKLADSFETELSIEQADYFIACKNGTMDLSFFPLSKEILMAYGCTELQAQEWTDYTKIPEELRDEVLAFCSNYFIDHYVETNDYYRKLAGLPEYSSTHPNDYSVTLSRYDYYDSDGVQHSRFDNLFAKDYTNTTFDHNMPLHEMSGYEVALLDGLGVIEAIKKIEINEKVDTSERTIIDPDGKIRVVPDTAVHYKYLNYLGAKSIDIYKARIAENWDILYMPAVEYLVEDRFKELYTINRDIYVRRTYQLAYDESSDYFAEIITLLIICQTFSDMITDTPEWYIRRDVFDLRTVQYFLTSQGVQFFEDIPMKYQIRIVKGLNKLIRYKSTDKNIFDILEIFDISGITVYKYFLMKNYLYSDVREFVVVGEEDPEWMMEAEYDFGDEEEEDIGDTGDGEGHDVPGAEVYDFVDMSDEDYVDPDAAYDYYYDFRSEEPDYWDESIEVEMLPEYDFYDEDEFPDEINNTGIDESGYEDHVKHELFDFGLLAWDVIEDYEERTYVYDFDSEDSGFVQPTEVTDRFSNYWEKIRTIKDEFGNVYNLEFVRVPTGELYDNYVKNSIYREPYDNVTKEDKYWDGEDVHYYIRNQHLDRDFTIEGTKYMRLDYDINMSESLYEKEYYLGLLLNARIDTDDVTVSIPQLSNKRFTLLNLLLFVYCLNGIYTDTNILVQDATEYVVKRTEDPIEFDAYTDYDGGYVWTDPQEPEPEPVEEPYYGYDDFGDEDVDDIDPDTIEVIWDFGFNYYIDWNTTPEYRSYDYGLITRDSKEDEYTPSRELPKPVDPASDYYYDKYVYIDPERPYYYCGALYVDQTNGELIPLTVDFINENNLIGTSVFIVHYWTGLTPEALGYYTLDVDNHSVDDWNDRDQYELHVDGGDVKYAARFTKHYFYDYTRSDHQKLYVDCVGRIYGFNMKNKLEDIAEEIGFRHSEFGFERGYTLEECGVADFISRESFSSIEDLYNVYQTNTECYKKLSEKRRDANTRDERMVLDYVFYKLFTLPWDTAFYILQNGEMADNYAQILEERDYALYEIYIQLLNEGDSTLRIYNTRNVLNDIADTLNYYIHGENLKYALSFISTISYDALLHYVFEMVNFFKSWKMHFLDPVLTYTIDAKNENCAAFGDQIVERKISYWTPENLKTSDSVVVTPWYYITEKPGDPKSNYNRMSEVTDIAAHYVEHDPLLDRDFNGNHPEDEDEYYDLDGGGVGVLTQEQLDYCAENNIVPYNKTCWPCYNMDAGRVCNGIDIYDLDGGSPVDAQHYLDIDGYVLNDPRCYVPGPSIEWNYLPGYEPESNLRENYNDIDCGGADIHLRTEGSIRMTIDKYNEKSSEVIRNTYPSNGLTIEDDGIYFDKSPYTVVNKMERQITSATTFKNNVINYFKNISYVAKSLTPDGLNQTVYSEMAKNFQKFLNVYGTVTDSYENEVVSALDNLGESLKVWFKENDPYAWTELVEEEESEEGA